MENAHNPYISLGWIAALQGMTEGSTRRIILPREAASRDYPELFRGEAAFFVLGMRV